MEWIKVSDGLPEHRVPVFAVVAPDDGPDYPPYREICLLNPNREWRRYDFIDEDDYPLQNGEEVTHWMPLPELPKVSK